MASLTASRRKEAARVARMWRADEGDAYEAVNAAIAAQDEAFLEASLESLPPTQRQRFLRAMRNWAVCPDEPEGELDAIPLLVESADIDPTGIALFYQEGEGLRPRENPNMRVLPCLVDASWLATLSALDYRRLALSVAAGVKPPLRLPRPRRRLARGIFACALTWSTGCMTEIMENPEEHRDSILTLIRGILGRCPGVIDVAWPCHPWEATAYARNDHDDWLVRSSGGETELAKFIAIAVQEGGAVRAECTRGQSAEVEVRLFDNTDRLVEHRTIPGDALPMSPGEVVSKISCLLPTRSTAPTNHGPAFGCPPPVRPSERPQFKVFFGNPSETHETTTIQDLKTMLPAVIEKWPKKGREPRSD